MEENIHIIDVKILIPHTCSIRPKSVSRNIVEEKFRTLLSDLELNPKLSALVEEATKRVLKATQNSSVEKELQLHSKLKEVEGALDRVLDKVIQVNSAKLLCRLEEEAERLYSEKSKTELEIQQFGVKRQNASEIALSRVMSFLTNPTAWWENGNLTQKRLVQSLMFTEPLTFSKNSGFGTPSFSLPFRVLQSSKTPKSNLVETAGVEPASVSSLPSALHV